jgi:hypothetical protein
MLRRIQTPAAEILAPACRESPWQALPEPFHRQSEFTDSIRKMAI